jgi:hypothetical protein
MIVAHPDLKGVDILWGSRCSGVLSMIRGHDADEAEQGDPSDLVADLRVLDKTDGARLMFAGSGSSTRPTFFRLFVVRLLAAKADKVVIAAFAQTWED